MKGGVRDEVREVNAAEKDIGGVAEEMGEGVGHVEVS